MKASDLLVKCLENEGIEYIFGVPGEENADFMMSLEQSQRIRFILTRHEQGAAFMAEVYGRLIDSGPTCISLTVDPKNAARSWSAIMRASSPRLFASLFKRTRISGFPGRRSSETSKAPS